MSYFNGQRPSIDEVLHNLDSSEDKDKVISKPQITAGQALDNINNLRRFLYA